jgi:hypothetical protein
MKKISFKHTNLLISCLAVCFWVVSVTPTLAFFNDREASPVNEFQGAVVNFQIDQSTDFATTGEFTLRKHSNSLDLYFDVKLRGGDAEVCADVSLTLTGPTASYTGLASEFTTLTETQLGTWTATTSRPDDLIVRDECPLTLEFTAWAEDTPQIGFSDTKDILVVVPGRSAGVNRASIPLDQETNDSFSTLDAPAPLTADSKNEPPKEQAEDSEPTIVEEVVEEGSADPKEGTEAEQNEESATAQDDVTEELPESEEPENIKEINEVTEETAEASQSEAEEGESQEELTDTSEPDAESEGEESGENLNQVTEPIHKLEDDGEEEEVTEEIEEGDDSPVEEPVAEPIEEAATSTKPEEDVTEEEGSETSV